MAVVVRAGPLPRLGAAAWHGVEIRRTARRHRRRGFTGRHAEAAAPVSGELPGDLADAAGRLLQTLASDAITQTTQAGR